MKTRIISAVVASVFGIIILILHNTIALPIAVALITGLMVYELLNVGKCLEYKATAYLLIFMAFGYQFTVYSALNKYRKLFVVFILMVVFLTFLIQHEKLVIEKLSYMLATSLLVTFSMNTILLLERSDSKHGLFYLILSLLGAWLADSGAYFAGTLFGKHKLCPKISPKKTVEGLIGGTVVNAILFIVIGLIYTQIQSHMDTVIHMNYIYLALLGIICSLLGLLGDLTASVIKRQHNIKDYGNIMPGHGGAMDRFDSVLFVLPSMYLALQFINIIK